MLCPKCGYISFDHLSACAKCHNDLSLVGEELHGTAIEGESRLFLGLVLKNAASASAIPVSADDSLAAAALEPDQDLQEMEPATLSLDDDFGGEADVAAVLPSDEASGLDFDLDEIPALDVSSLEQAPAAEQAEEEELSFDALEPAPLDLNLEEDDAAIPPPVETEGSAPLEELPELAAADDDLEIDALSLSLDAADENAPTSIESGASEPAEEQGQLSIDLDEIDLSDLVHDTSGGASPPAAAEVPPSDTESVEFDTSMDLSLLASDDQGENTAAGFSLDDTGLEPIDLTLMDDALIDIAVDPARKDISSAKSPPESELELTMEENAK